MYKENEIESQSSRVVETVKSLLKGRAGLYEVFFLSDKGISAESQGMSVDALKVRFNAGAGLRVISNGRPGFAFTNLLNEDSVGAMVDTALSGSVETAADGYLGFPSPSEPFCKGDLEIFDISYGSTSEEEKIARAVEIERGARETSGKITRVRKASYQESERTTRVVNSEGVDVTRRATFFSGHVTAIAEEGGEAQMGWEIGLGHKRGALEPYAIGRAAALDALDKLGAREIKTVKCPAVIKNTVVCEFLESLVGSFLADNVCKGKSMLKDRVGELVVSDCLNIYDDGALKGGWASGAFDGEGAPSSRTSIIENGVLGGFLYDSYWAKRLGVRSTGNASRSGYKDLPSVGISNLYMEKAGKGPSLTGLLKRMQRGLFITEVMGVHTINPVTGDFSLGASGRWVEDGGLSYPVKGAAVSGNLLDLFSNVEDTGDDMRFIGAIGAPSIYVNEIEASGK